MITTRFKYTDWSEVHSLAWNLGRLIEPVFQPDVVIAIARGGLVVGRIMADYFSLSDLFAINIESAGSQTVRTVEPQICIPLLANLEGRSVLVVDDIASTGYSLQTVKRYVYDKGGCIIKTAALVCILPKNKVRPDFYIQEYKGEHWFTYPWTITEDLNHIARQDTYIFDLYALGDITGVKQYFFRQYDLDLSEEIVFRSLEKIYNNHKNLL